MSSVSLPVNRPSGTTLVVASPSARPMVLALVAPLQFTCIEANDVYAGMVLLCRQPGLISCIILSLTSCYREELVFIESVKRQFPGIEVWLTQTDGRHAALIEAMRLGADGLLSDEGFHRIAVAAAPVASSAAGAPSLGDSSPVHLAPIESYADREVAMGEPVLSADELRALLHEQPGNPPVHGS